MPNATAKERKKKKEEKKENIVQEIPISEPVKPKVGKKRNYNCDLVVNVSGPMSVKKITNEIPLLYSLKKRNI